MRSGWTNRFRYATIGCTVHFRRQPDRISKGMRSMNHATADGIASPAPAEVPPTTSIIAHFSSLPDPRIEKKTKHNLEDIIVNLRYVVSNARFLILHWIKSRNLASRILGGIIRQLPQDWEERYHYRPVLLETFVQLDRFTGTCYKAANWVRWALPTGTASMAKNGKNWSPTKPSLFVH